MFEHTKPGTTVIPLFRVILTEKKTNFDSILMIQGHLGSQKVNFKVKYDLSTNKATNNCKNSFWTGKFIYGIILMSLRHLQGQNIFYVFLTGE